MSNPIPDQDFVYNALLRYNYLPIGKKHPDDIPFEVFSTEDFTSMVADEMLSNTKKRKNKGYDQIEYSITRLPNVTRLMHIPHPLPYAHLCKCISEHWNQPEVKRICKNKNSFLKPQKHDNGRLIMGEYQQLKQIHILEGGRDSDIVSKIEGSTGMFYRVKADISSFFPSIYTHTIPWALVGRDEAKANSNKDEKWYNQLDILQRELKRKESQGIPIGPATSNILAEIILCRVDEELSRIHKDSYFLRYIDDYECYCETRERAEAFIIDLEHELRKYLLNLNSKKVIIEELPISFQEKWIIILKNNLPSIDKLDFDQIMTFLDLAVDLQRHYPEKNVLKYAARTISNLGNIKGDCVDSFLKYLNALAVYNPSILPILCQIAKKYHVGSNLDVTPVLKQSIKFRRSDAICWSLYFMGISGQSLCEEIAKEIIETSDCMSMGMLIALNQHEQKVLDFLQSIKYTSNYDLDQYWILIYEFASSLEKYNIYLEKSGLKFLKDNNVQFIRPIVNND